MRCSDIEELISAYADDELLGTQRDFVEEHLASCADCRVTLEDYRLIRRQLTSLRATPVPAPIHAATLLGIKKARSRNLAHRWLRPALVGVPLAATLAALLVLQPWSTTTPGGALARTFNAIAGVQSFRTSNSEKVILQGSTTEIESFILWEFATPDNWHMVITQGDNKQERIHIGGLTYVLPWTEPISDSTAGAFTDWAPPTAPSQEQTIKTLQDLMKFGTLVQVVDETVNGALCLHYWGATDWNQLVDTKEASLNQADTQYEQKFAALEAERTNRTHFEIWIGKDDYLIRKWQQEEVSSSLYRSWTTLYYDWNKPIVVEAPLDASGNLLPGWKLGTDSSTGPIATPSPDQSPKPRVGTPGKVWGGCTAGYGGELTVGSILGNCVQVNGGWVCFQQPCVTVTPGTGDYAFGEVVTSINPETGQIYISQIIWMSEDEYWAHWEKTTQ
jgi:hypothetical protein